MPPFIFIAHFILFLIFILIIKIIALTSKSNPNNSYHLDIVNRIILNKMKSSHLYLKQPKFCNNIRQALI